MDIRRRLISRIASTTPDGDIDSVDVATLVRQLILFDTCVLKTHDLREFPFLVRSFGLDGTLELLSSGVLEIMWGRSPFLVLVDVHKDGKRVLPLFHFDCGIGSIADPEEATRRCFQCFHELTDIPHKRILQLKKAVVSRFVGPPKGFETMCSPKLSRN